VIAGLRGSPPEGPESAAIAVIPLPIPPDFWICDFVSYYWQLVAPEDYVTGGASYGLSLVLNESESSER
jgi:hypothetical protein